MGDVENVDNYSKLGVLGLTLNVFTSLDNNNYIGQVQYYNQHTNMLVLSNHTFKIH